MELSIPFIVFLFSTLALVSVLLSKVAERYSIPILLLFLGLGMLAGSEGIGGFYFDDPVTTQWISTIALAVILFAGGLDTNWEQTKPILKEGLTLGTLGVLLTAGLVGLFIHFILKLPFLDSFLIGAIISSTDAPAVFSVLRTSGIALKGRLKPLLEFEAGSNDPMAIFLTIGTIQLLTNPSSIPLDLLLLFILQMGVGAAAGWLLSKFALYMVNRLKLGYEGLYPVLMLAMVFLTFGLTALLQGSGYLAVYILGLMLGRNDFLHKRSLTRFFDGTAWLMQIGLFITLGLLVFPSRIPQVILPGLLVAGMLILIARPVSVFLSLIPFRYSFREKVFLSWVGLKGAVPIVLATFPLIAGIAQSETVFNLVFFVVIASVLLQGTLIAPIARWLKLDKPVSVKPDFPLEVIAGHKINGKFTEILIPENSTVVGKSIYQLRLPQNYLVILIQREGEYIQPNGATELHAGDKLFSLSDGDTLKEACAILTKPAGQPDEV